MAIFVFKIPVETVAPPQQSGWLDVGSLLYFILMLLSMVFFGINYRVMFRLFFLAHLLDIQHLQGRLFG